MAKPLIREEAIQLRLKGFTYSQIKRELNVQKSTLSNWLKNISLTEEQLNSLASNKERAEDIRKEKYRKTRQNKKLNRLGSVYAQQIKELLPLSKKELFLIGVFLYWGEGEKTHGKISVSNSNPKVIQFTLYWMIHALGVPKEKIRVNLHLYKDMNIAESITYWSKALGLPKEQFRKPYIKDSNRLGLTYKSFGRGTCRLYFGSVELSEKIAMAIKAISDSYGVKDSLYWYN